MYREQTVQVKRRQRLMALAGVIVALALALVAWQAWANADVITQDQSANSVRQAVLDMAMQCCAVEGAYPSSVEYLEEHYGLQINHDEYYVQYEIFASNVMPSVVVVPR